MVDSDTQIDSFGSFECFELDARLLEAVAKLKYTEPTPIQEVAIPALLSGRDVVGRARTGSGKTAAFGLPLLHAAATVPAAGVRALVVTPTRELALQVTDALRSYSTGTGIKFVCIYGGSPYGPQLKALRSGVPVVVGTPGRLLDHLKRGSLDLSNVEIVVLDEADEMLRMGFIDDVSHLLESTPQTRQIALFSATMPGPIRRVAAAYLKDPVEAQVESGAHAVDHIEQFCILVPYRHRLDALDRVLRSKAPGAALVFAQTRVGCADLAEELAKRGFAVDALHGDLSQSARERVLARFRNKQLDIVVATDVASRGIDVEHITHVINLDLPRDTDSYVHRIGRTSRAGREGTAISFVAPGDHRRVGILERTLRTTIKKMLVPTDADIAQRNRGQLHADLRNALEQKNDVLKELPEFLAAGEWTIEELALAAVRALAAERGLKLDEEPNTQPPRWAQAEPKMRGPRKVSESNDTADRAFDTADRAPNEVELLLFTGRERGTRPADLVGALTAETGVPGRLLGRISIADRKSFVGCSRETAERILSGRSSLEIRGQAVRMQLARPMLPGDDRRFRRRKSSVSSARKPTGKAGSGPIRRAKHRKISKTASR